MMSFSFETQLDPVALAAAILALLSLGLQAVKHFRSKPRLRLSVMDSAEIYGPISDPNMYVHIKAVNMGERPTKVTLLSMRYWKRPWRRWLSRGPDKQFVVQNPVPNSGGLPGLAVMLGPGEEWAGVVTHNDELVQMGRDGYLEIEVSHSVSKRPARKRVRIETRDYASPEGDESAV